MDYSLKKQNCFLLKKNVFSCFASLSTNHKSLCFVRIQYNAPVIEPLLNPGQVTVQGGSNSRSVCWLANNLPLMWSRQKRHIVCSLPAQTFHWYKGWTEEDPTHLPVARQKRWDPLTSSTINHDYLPTVLEELPTNGLPPTSIDFNLKKIPLWGSTKVELYPCI